MGRPIRRFIQAFDRADRIATALFTESGEVWALVSTDGDESPRKKRLKPFKRCGLRKPDFDYLGATPQNDEDHIAEFETDLYRHWDAVRLNEPIMIREILWLALGAELGIRPAMRASVYLVGFENAVILHPYDDRGMDIISMNKDELSGLYRDFNSYLSEHDMPRMTASLG